ncbi:hypothetical protein [Streptomyces smyrnaeus]|uniref:hypothetical protein n=1 Tax=Streptomyces smyrnaeus TaxID=1387713 RepID=UPI0036AA16CC
MSVEPVKGRIAMPLLRPPERPSPSVAAAAEPSVSAARVGLAERRWLVTGPAMGAVTGE